MSRPTEPIDLDSASATMPSPAVVAAVASALRERWHNPSSVHRAGQAARALLERSRRAIGALVGAAGGEVVLTSGSTEAAHLALCGAIGRPTLGTEPLAVIIGAVEHAAVRGAAERCGASVGWAAVDRHGRVDVDALRVMLGSRPTRLVSVQMANNETGVVQPMREIVRAAHEHGALVHSDGSHLVGRERCDVGELGVDLLSFSPHKFHGPRGVGVLVVRRGVRLRALQQGSQERGLRGGTEDVAAIAGAAVACDEARGWLDRPELAEQQRGLRSALEQRLVRGVEGARVIGAELGERGRVWSTCAAMLPGCTAEAMVMGLSELGVWVSAGSACASGAVEESHVLRAMGVEPALASCTLRMSLGRDTTLAQVERAAEIVCEVARRVRANAG